MKLMISCKEAAEMMSEAQDQSLPFMRRMALKFHLSMCYGCRRYKKQLQIIRDLARGYLTGIERTKPPEARELPPETREKIKSALKNHHNH